MLLLYEIMNKPQRTLSKQRFEKSQIANIPSFLVLLFQSRKSIWITPTLKGVKLIYAFLFRGARSGIKG